MSVARHFPQLTADANYKELQRQIQEVDQAIETRRVEFNQAVKDYNVVRSAIPNTIFAKYLKMKPEPYFTHDDAASYEFAGS